MTELRRIFGHEVEKVKQVWSKLITAKYFDQIKEYKVGGVYGPLGTYHKFMYVTIILKSILTY